METTTLGLSDIAGLSDPVEQWSFDVLIGSAKPSFEITRAKATATTLALTFVVTENLKLGDFTPFGITVRLYQRIADADNGDKYIDLKYKLSKLKATTFDLDGVSGSCGIPSLMYITQVYTYDGLTIESK